MSMTPPLERSRDIQEAPREACAGNQRCTGDITSASKTSGWGDSYIIVNFPAMGDITYSVSMTLEGTSGSMGGDINLAQSIIYDKTGSSLTVLLSEFQGVVQDITLNFIIMDY